MINQYDTLIVSSGRKFRSQYMLLWRNDRYVLKSLLNGKEYDNKYTEEYIRINMAKGEWIPILNVTNIMKEIKNG